MGDRGWSRLAILDDRLVACLKHRLRLLRPHSIIGVYAC